MSDWPTVVIIEDSVTQAKQIAAELSDYEVRVLIADDGPQGLRLVYSELPDVILLDVNLPSMSGYQVCRRLKRDEETAHIPVIMLTALDSADETLQGLDAGAIDYIPKDAFATENLLATLRSLNLIADNGD